MTRDQVLAEALSLDPADRETLAQDLLLSLSDSDFDAIERAWLGEARRRGEVFARGEMGSVMLDETIARVQAGRHV